MSKRFNNALIALILTLTTGSLFAQNSLLTLYLSSSIPGSTPVTISAVATGSMDTTIVDTLIAEFGETTVSYTFPDTTASMTITLSWMCEGVQVPAIPFFVGNNMPGEPFDSAIAVEIGCQDSECEWYLNVNPPNDLASPTTLEVIAESSPVIYEWYVDGELVPPNMDGGGLSWSEPFETICAAMYSLGECTDLDTQCYENPDNSDGGMNCLDGIDVGALIVYLTTNCGDQTNPDSWMYCGLLESLTAALNGDQEACADLWAWLDAGGWESEMDCDINFEVMQGWDANGEPIPSEVWVLVYDYNSEYTYTYNFGDESPVTSEPNPTHTYSGYGPYEFCITVSSEADSCSAIYCETLSVDSLGFIDEFMSGFTVYVMGAGEVVNNVESQDWTDTFEFYPNPVVQGQLQLHGLNFRQGFPAVELTTLTGESIPIDLSNGEVQDGRLTLPLEGLAPGIYLLRIEQRNVWTTRKVVIR